MTSRASSGPLTDAGRTASARTEVVLRPNLLGIPVGVAGLALCWSTAATLLGTPRWPAQGLWLLTAVLWTVVTVACLGQAVRGHRVMAELTHPTFGPFTALPAVIAMLLGGALAPYAPSAGLVVFLVGLVAALAMGGFLTGQWVITDLRLAEWHPGYFIPTTAAGLVAAGVAPAVGLPRVAEVMFGYGVVCWIVLGSIILTRLFTQPALPPALWPTIAIELVPSATAGNAWFVMNGGRPDLVAMLIAGYGLLMVLVQLRLVPRYLAAPFGPASWAFAFAYAAAVTVGLHWLATGRGPAAAAVAYVLLFAITVGVVLLSIRTVHGLARRTFLPTEPGTGAP